MITVTDPDYLALVNKIKETPSDDIPRLLAADWLEENEETSSCPHCDGTGFVPYSDAAGDMDDRPCKSCDGKGYGSNGYAKRASLIRSQCNSLCNPITVEKVFDHHLSKVLYARGFVYSVTCTLEEWLLNGPSICRCNPVEILEITDQPQSVADIFFGQRFYFRLPFVYRDRTFSTVQEARNDAGANLLKWAKLKAASPDGRIDPKAFAEPRPAMTANGGGW